MKFILFSILICLVSSCDNYSSFEFKDFKIDNEIFMQIQNKSEIKLIPTEKIIKFDNDNGPDDQDYFNYGLRNDSIFIVWTIKTGKFYKNNTNFYCPILEDYKDIFQNARLIYYDTQLKDVVKDETKRFSTSTFNQYFVIESTNKNETYILFNKMKIFASDQISRDSFKNQWTPQIFGLYKGVKTSNQIVDGDFIVNEFNANDELKYIKKCKFIKY